MTDKQPVTQQDSALVEVENFAPQSSLLDSIISESRVARSETERTRTRDLIGELVAQVLEGEMTPSKDLIAVLDARIAEIDSMLSEQMNEIMHAREFQQLEASWRGLKYQVDQTETSTTLKIHLLNASKKTSCVTSRPRPNSTRAHCSRRSTKKSTAPSVVHRSVCCWGLRVQPQPGRHVPARGDLPRCSRRPRAVHFRGIG